MFAGGRLETAYHIAGIVVDDLVSANIVFTVFVLVARFELLALAIMTYAVHANVAIFAMPVGSALLARPHV